MNSAIQRIGLRLDLRRRGRELPCADIAVQHRRDEVAERADRRRAEVMYPKNRGCPLKSE